MEDGHGMMSTYGAVPATSAETHATDRERAIDISISATDSHSALNSRVWTNVGRATLAGLAIVGTIYLGKGAIGRGGASSGVADLRASVRATDKGSFVESEKQFSDATDDATATATDTAAKPHIVFFLLDDAGWNDFGYNSVDFKGASPNMDVLAAEGITLHNYYTQVSHVHLLHVLRLEGVGWRVHVLVG